MSFKTAGLQRNPVWGRGRGQQRKIKYFWVRQGGLYLCNLSTKGVEVRGSELEALGLSKVLS